MDSGYTATAHKQDARPALSGTVTGNNSRFDVFAGPAGTGAQFIIATHSPILMAYPDAVILQMTPDGPQEIAYTETEHYTVTRYFLLRTELMLDTLLAPAPNPDAD